MLHTHVSIVGAGLGGLCLAQGLKRAGIDFAVYERDSAIASRSQGYRIRIDADGQDALACCLPENLYALFRHSAIASEGARLLGRDLAPVPWSAPEHWRTNEAQVAAPDLCADRQILREILLSGIEERVHFDMPFERFHQLDDDTVRIDFANGKVGTTALLVGADGVHSLVRSQLLPDACPEETEVVCIYGKTASSSALRESVGPILCKGTSVIFAEGLTAIVDPMFFPEPLADIAARLAPRCRVEAADDYFYWALVGFRQRLGIGAWPHRADLPQLIASLTGSWHPQLRALFSGARDSAITILPVRSASPTLAAWPSGQVTLLGDAVHVMSPAAGAGANTALRDAAALADALSRSSGTHEVFSNYEPAMRERASRAICASIESTRRLCELYPTTQN